ncbi:MAG: hypothetical protein DHS20C14_17240 [Phycisphaeraceae bacterium]|nr:MAG: hypothetical protein DHS20C14_17240 [Phycisphaeraceae bacterium]
MNRRSAPWLGAAAALAGAAGLAQAQTQPDEAALARVAAAQAAFDAAQAELDAAQADLDAAEAAAAIPEPEPGLLDKWEGTVQAGITGTTGNSENFNFRLGLNAERLTEKMETRFDALYRYSTSEGTDTTNRFEAGLRNDWLFTDSPWRIFAQGRYEYDEFQDWDHRISGFVGVGYEFIDNDTTTLIGRAGIGGNQTIGGADERFTPEGLLGLDFTHKLDDAQEIALGTEVLPSLDPFGEYRVNSYADYTVMVNPENNMFLKAGVKHRWDSDPGAAKRSDLDYYLTLGWGF